MFKRALPLLALLALAGCGGTASTETTTTATAATTTVTAYFLRGNELTPVRVRVPATRAVAAAALRALFAGPPRGSTTAIPPGARFDGVTVANGEATARLADLELDFPRAAQAQVVYTLTQFPAIRSVRQLTVTDQHSFVPLQDWTGESLDGAADRQDYVDFTRDAPIFVETPVRGASVTSPVRIAGTASVYEANIVIDAWTASKRVVHTFTTATAAAPERGRFEATIDLPPGRVNVMLVEPDVSQRGGIHFMTEVQVHVTP